MHQVELAKREQYQLPLSATWNVLTSVSLAEMPICWRSCQALMGDACLSITPLRAAASSSHALRPFECDGPFIDVADVKDLLAEHQKLDRSLLDAPSCVDFKAAKPLGKLSPIMYTTGMAALVCRHEFVAFAVNMFTPENFCYYDIMLERMLKQYSQESGCLLMCFFLDIACQFRKYWNR